MDSVEVQTACLLAAKQAKVLGITQSEIASAVGASQSQVSRVLAGHARRRSNLVDRVCIYVSRAAKGASSKALRENDELMDAIASVWDGSAHQARLLANLIRAVGTLLPAQSATFSGRIAVERR